MEKKIPQQKRSQLVLQYLQLAFIDYVGARTLLRSQLPLQGAVLASTAVEKYFKAIAVVGGKQLCGHLGAKHVKQIKQYTPNLFEKLNPEFLKFLERCYTLRYTDSLERGFTLKVFARETLAELDHTVYNTEMQINVRRDDGGRVLSAYRNALQKKTPNVFDDNHVLQNISKTDFLRRPDKAYAILNRPEGLLEVEFTVFESPTDGQFNRPGIWNASSPRASEN